MTIWAANADDRARVIELWRITNLIRPWNDPVADFDRALQTATARIFLMMAERRPVATVMAGFDGHRGWIYYLAVDPGFGGRGYARKLLAHAEDWLRNEGCPKVELMVRDGNPAAGFYEHLGWTREPVEVYSRRLVQGGPGRSMSEPR
ncbi:MAG: GNAT family acetyltransferase [Pseudomonadota bacterium]